MSLLKSWSKKKAIAGPGLGALLGAVFFVFTFGAKILNPTYINWLLTRSDASMFFLGWSFFRKEPWSFPPGEIHGYLAPVGTTIGLTDSIPLLAFPLKMISFILPETFQYFGFWTLLSFSLQGVFGYLLGSRISRSLAVRLLIAAFFITSPVMLHRALGHIALGSHWLLLAAIWLFFHNFDRLQARREIVSWVLLLLVCCFVHPYLTVMVLGICLCRLLKAFLIEHRISWWMTLALGLGSVLAVLAFWYISGTMVPGQSADYLAFQFGHYSMNLNAPWNPLKNSLFMREFPHATTGQYEGYNYLGLGMLFSTLVAISLAFVRSSWRPSLKRNWPLLAGALLLGLFALSNKVTFGESVLFTIPMPDSLHGIMGSLRSSGRFLWPAYYLIFLGSLAMIVKNLDRKIAISVLSLALILQVADIYPIVQQKQLFLTYTSASRMKSPQWDEIATEFTHIATYPPMQTSTQFDGDFRHIGLFAVQNGMTTSAGYAARVSPTEAAQQRQQMDSLFVQGQPDPETFYIIKDSVYLSVREQMGDRFKCTEIDGFKVCFPAESALPTGNSDSVEKMELAEFSQLVQDKLVVLMVKDEATAQLHKHWIDAIKGLGLNLTELPYRGSYVGVGYKGQALWENMRGDSDVTVQFKSNSQLGPVTWKNDIQARSAGYAFGNKASLKINGQENLAAGRGLNFVVFDEDQNIEMIAQFDTHGGKIGVVLKIVSSEENQESP